MQTENMFKKNSYKPRSSGSSSSGSSGSSSSTSIPVKIYFPNISPTQLHDSLYNKKSKSSALSNINMSKYLVDETIKTSIYGSTGVLEVHDNNLYQVYPIDKPVAAALVEKDRDKIKINVLIDMSYMKRFSIPSFQIPYKNVVEHKVVKTYKLNPKSNTKFIIEMKNDIVYDFYILTSSNDLNSGDNNVKNKMENLITNKIELNTFLKEDIISFLLVLNLYR
jgi:hypothetical protein